MIACNDVARGTKITIQSKKSTYEPVDACEYPKRVANDVARQTEITTIKWMKSTNLSVDAFDYHKRVAGKLLSLGGKLES